MQDLSKPLTFSYSDIFLKYLCFSTFMLLTYLTWPSISILTVPVLVCYRFSTTVLYITNTYACYLTTILESSHDLKVLIVQYHCWQKCKWPLTSTENNTTYDPWHTSSFKTVLCCSIDFFFNSLSEKEKYIISK